MKSPPCSDEYLTGLARLFLFALVVAAQASVVPSIETEQEGSKANNQHILVGTSQLCGQELLNAESGSIQYKVSESLVPNERCVWVIQVPEATGYLVGIFSLGFPEPSIEHQVTITSLFDNGPTETTIPDHLGMYDLTPASTLIVTFHTGIGVNNASNMNGFLLEYTARFESSSSVRNSFVEFHYADEEANFGYYSASSPTLLTLGLTIFNWEDSYYNPNRKVQLAFVKEQGWVTTTRMEVYEFHPESNWQLNRTLDSSMDIEMFKSSEPVILAFRRSAPTSDSSGWGLLNYPCADTTN